MKNVFKLAVAAVILACGMVLSALYLSKLFIRVRQEQAITVKGYAERDVVSDVGKFTCAFAARGASLRDAFDRLQHSKRAVMVYLKQAGFGDEDVTAGTIRTSRVMKRDAQGRETNEIEYHDASQEIAVTSSNVTLVKTVATGITELIKEGVDISASDPAFYVSDLKDTKMNLLAEATRDGLRRAGALAANSGGRVGALIAARQGVFQITERNSTDVSGYGEYDTSTIAKTAKAVVTLEYAIEPGPVAAASR
ncbi:MAG: SIMPL domain-containing protein [Kiritimatiellae bacterium]|nr:SIMPL domain-containing protein [Kiritimatiellia bacterium]